MPLKPLPWNLIMQDLFNAGFKQKTIAERCGFRSASSISEIASGVIVEVPHHKGEAIRKLHATAKRRLARAGVTCNV